MDEFFNGVPPTIEPAPKRDKKYYGGIPDGHINLFDDRATMLAWATGKRGVRKDRTEGKERRRQLKEAAKSTNKETQDGQD